MATSISWNHVRACTMATNTDQSDVSRPDLMDLPVQPSTWFFHLHPYSIRSTTSSSTNLNGQALITNSPSRYLQKEEFCVPKARQRQTTTRTSAPFKILVSYFYQISVDGSCFLRQRRHSVGALIDRLSFSLLPLQTASTYRHERSRNYETQAGH